MAKYRVDVALVYYYVQGHSLQLILGHLKTGNTDKNKYLNSFIMH